MLPFRTRLIDLTFRAATASGILDVWQIITRSTCAVLLYHSVASGPENPYFGPDEYERHMELLSAEFRVLSADEFLWHLDRGRAPPRRSVLITFDDGFENNATVVQPIMERRGLPWVLFTTTAALNQPGCILWFSALRGVCLYSRAASISLLGGSWPLSDRDTRLAAFAGLFRLVSKSPWSRTRPALEDLLAEHFAAVPPPYVQSFCAMMTSAQLRVLAESPLVEVGCHTESHPFLTTVSDEALPQEIDAPTRMLAEIVDRPVRLFAYPAGDYGRREVERVAGAGFACAFAVTPVKRTRPRFEVSRAGVYDPSVNVVRAKSLGVVNILRRVGVSTG